VFPPAKEPYKRDDIPQKRPIILRSLLIGKRLAKPPTVPTARKLVSTNPRTAPARAAISGFTCLEEIKLN